MRVAHGAFVGILGWSTLTGSAAHAQSPAPVDTRTFRPSLWGSSFLVTETEASSHPAQMGGTLWPHYALVPVRLSDAPTPGNHLNVLEHQALVEPTLHGRLFGLATVGVSVPIALYQTGSPDVALPPLRTTRPATTAVGDPSIGVLKTLRENGDGGWGWASYVLATVPVGKEGALVGGDAFRYGAGIIADYNFLIAGAQVKLGYEGRGTSRSWPDAPPAPGSRPLTWGGSLPWSAAVRLDLGGLPGLRRLDPHGRQSWELALRGALPAGPVAPFGLGREGSSWLSPVMLSWAHRIRVGGYGDGFLTAGVDVGLTEALGVPIVRGILGFGWAFRTHDADGDGIEDAQDQCAEYPEDRDGFEDEDGCPEVDNDDDGFVDEEDACPRIPGGPSSDSHKQGCPP